MFEFVDSFLTIYLRSTFRCNWLQEASRGSRCSRCLAIFGGFSARALNISVTSKMIIILVISDWNGRNVFNFCPKFGLAPSPNLQKLNPDYLLHWLVTSSSLLNGQYRLNSDPKNRNFVSFETVRRYHLKSSSFMSWLFQIFALVCDRFNKIIRVLFIFSNEPKRLHMLKYCLINRYRSNLSTTR